MRIGYVRNMIKAKNDRDWGNYWLIRAEWFSARARQASRLDIVPGELELCEQAATDCAWVSVYCSEYERIVNKAMMDAELAKYMADTERRAELDEQQRRSEVFAGC